MLKNVIRTAFLIINMIMAGFQLLAQEVQEPQNTPAEWSKAYPAFRIAGNLYYVGTHDLACYLITTPKGNILINTGLANSAPIIQANIESLGFKFSDTKILLTTQAHYDHMGAMAAIKKQTGAKLMINSKEAEVLADGGRSDYALGGSVSTYQPLVADRLLSDGDIIKLGKMKVVMLHHAGHTKGSSSFLFDVKDNQRSYKVLIANMPSIVTDKKFSEIPAYPTISQDYANTLNAMKNLSFDIWLASHASQFGLHSKHQSGEGYNPAVFIDKAGYEKALSTLQDQYSKKIKNQN